MGFLLLLYEHAFNILHVFPCPLFRSISWRTAAPYKHHKFLEHAGATKGIDLFRSFTHCLGRQKAGLSRSTKIDKQAKQSTEHI